MTGFLLLLLYNTLIMKICLLLVTAILMHSSCNDQSSNKQPLQSESSTTGHQSHIGIIDSAGSTSLMSTMDEVMRTMKSISSAGNTDIDFASLMKAHHAGAIEMAEMEVEQGSDTVIINMAKKMIANQRMEISAFNKFLSANYKHGNDSAYYKASMSVMDKMKMKMHHSPSFDLQFLTIMIPHHKSGVAMALTYLLQTKASRKESTEPPFKKLAEQIISSQQQQIILMKRIVNKMKS